MLPRSLPVALLLVSGCSDYTLTGMKEYSGLGDSGAEFEADTGGASVDIPEGDSAATSVVEATESSANASINVIFQYVTFGQEASACSFDVAFYAVSEDDGFGGGGTAQTIALPTSAGTCAFTRFDPDDTGTGGSMTVQGTLDAGAELHASNADYDVTLSREENEDGSVRYRWNDCTEDTFPFAATLSLSGTGVDGGISAFTLTDAIAVGPDMTQLAPAASDLDAGILPQSVTEPLSWEWSWSADFPATSEGAVEVSELFVLRNQRRADNQLLEALACQPSTDGALTVSAADLSQLTPDPGDDSTYACAQLDARFSGAEADAPWGQTLRAQSLISVSGLVRLAP